MSTMSHAGAMQLLKGPSAVVSRVCRVCVLASSCMRDATWLDVAFVPSLVCVKPWRPVIMPSAAGSMPLVGGTG